MFFPVLEKDIVLRSATTTVTEFRQRTQHPGQVFRLASTPPWPFTLMAEKITSPRTVWPDDHQIFFTASSQCVLVPKCRFIRLHGEDESAEVCSQKRISQGRHTCGCFPATCPAEDQISFCQLSGCERVVLRELNQRLVKIPLVHSSESSSAFIGIRAGGRGRSLTVTSRFCADL